MVQCVTWVCSFVLKGWCYVMLASLLTWNPLGFKWRIYIEVQNWINNHSPTHSSYKFVRIFLPGSSHWFREKYHGSHILLAHSTSISLAYTPVLTSRPTSFSFSPSLPPSPFLSRSNLNLIYVLPGIWFQPLCSVPISLLLIRIPKHKVGFSDVRELL